MGRPKSEKQQQQNNNSKKKTTGCVCVCELRSKKRKPWGLRITKTCRHCNRKRKEERGLRDLGDRGVVSLSWGHELHLRKLLDDIQQSRQNKIVVEDVVEDEMKGKLEEINTYMLCEKAIKYSSLTSNNSLNNELYCEFMSKENYQQNHHHYSISYQRIMDFRLNLPIHAAKDNIVKMVESNQVSLITGETACGKTTQVAQYILDDYIARQCGSMCRIVCTQPRRLSTVSVAERVARERDEPLGKSCGFKIRMESVLPRKQGSILFCTLGILLRFMISDLYLQKVSHVIIDEIHERRTLSDFLLIIIKTILQRRPGLKIILMSATLDAEIFSKYFNNCPMMNIPGRTYPVQDLYLEEILERIDYDHHKPYKCKTLRHQAKWKKKDEKMEDEKMEDEYLAYLNSIEAEYTAKTMSNLKNMNLRNLDDIFHELIIAIVNYICQSSTEGAILIFLPGWQDIQQLYFEFTNHKIYSNKSNFIIIPLHSKLPSASQGDVFDWPPFGCRKIIIATDIAETSITIDDIIYVIDCGKNKEKSYNINSNISSLDTVWISKSSVKQRSGRTGRVQPGHCYRLYTKFHENNFREFPLPEILRTPLEELCLQLKVLKCGNMFQFLSKAIEPPTPEACQQAIDKLMLMGALDKDEKLTAFGYSLALLPAPPKIGKMILYAAIFSCLDPALTVAASLLSDDPFFAPTYKQEEAYKRKLLFCKDSKSDHIVFVNAFEGWECAERSDEGSTFCQQNYLSMSSLKLIADMKCQFTHILKEIGFVQTDDPKSPDSNRNSKNINIIKAVVCAGVYPNVAKVEYNFGGTEFTLRCTGFTIKSAAKLNHNNELPLFVDIHPKSVNRHVKEFQSQWIIYHERMKTSRTFIYDTSVISPYPLLFFGSALSYRKSHFGDESIANDKNIKFHSSRTTANIIIDLRKELDKIILKKMRNPSMELFTGCTSNWDEKIMNAITDLICHDKVQDKKSMDLLPAAMADNKATARIDDIPDKEIVINDAIAEDNDFNGDHYDALEPNESGNSNLISRSKHLDESEATEQIDDIPHKENVTKNYGNDNDALEDGESENPILNSRSKHLDEFERQTKENEGDVQVKFDTFVQPVTDTAKNTLPQLHNSGIKVVATNRQYDEARLQRNKAKREIREHKTAENITKCKVLDKYVHDAFKQKKMDVVYHKQVSLLVEADRKGETTTAQKLVNQLKSYTTTYKT